MTEKIEATVIQTIETDIVIGTRTGLLARGVGFLKMTTTTLPPLVLLQIEILRHMHHLTESTGSLYL